MYSRFTRFLLPLILTIIIFEFGGQIINAGMARMPDATRNLAAFGLAWALVTVLASPLVQTRHAGLVLVEDKRDFWRGMTFVGVLALIMTSAQWLISGTPLSHLVLEGLHGIDPEIGDLVRTVLLWLLPLPAVRGITQFSTGVLTRGRRTSALSIATGLSVAAGFAVVVGLLRVELILRHPIWLPILATYAAVLVEFFVILWYLSRFWPEGLPNQVQRPVVSYQAIWRFSWPLALMIFVQEFSRPLINLFVVRGAGGPEALAALTVAYALGQWPYRWLNEMRALLPAFYPEVRSYRPFLRYAYWCGLVSFGISIALFWTPLRSILLEQVVGVPPELAAMARVPLQLFAFFSIVVMFRAYLHGIAFIERRTEPMAIGAPMRIIAILSMLLLLPLWGITGATWGIAALLAGFAVETITIWWGLSGRGHGWDRVRNAYSLLHIW